MIKRVSILAALVVVSMHAVPGPCDEESFQNFSLAGLISFIWKSPHYSNRALKSADIAQVPRMALENKTLQRRSCYTRLAQRLSACGGRMDAFVSKVFTEFDN